MKKLEQCHNVAMFETPIPQDDILGNKQIRQSVNRPIAMHFGSPPYITSIRERVCDGYVIGGGKSEVVRQGALSAEAQMPFWLQLVGNGLTTTWAAHLGAVLTHATWPTISCINIYSDHLLKKPIEVVGGYQQVPDGPGLGVEVDEDAVEKYRVSQERLDGFEKRGEPIHPQPEVIKTVVYPDGSCIHMVDQGLGYFNAGNGPAYVEGVRLEIRENDGSNEWRDLYSRAQKQPVRDHWR